MESCSSNASTKDFFLVGFPALQDFQTPLFFVFLLFYLLILVGNAIIITVVVVDRTLHKPMYFFLLNLSVLDVLFTTTTIPKMLAMFLANAKTISRLFQRARPTCSWWALTTPPSPWRTSPTGRTSPLTSTS